VKSVFSKNEEAVFDFARHAEISMKCRREQARLKQGLQNFALTFCKFFGSQIS